MSDATESMLAVRGLNTIFPSDRGRLHVVRDVSFDLAPGEVLGIVGESGSGKSVTLRSLVRLHRPPTEITGNVIWKGEDLLRLDAGRMQDVRGGEISMIFQEPMTALNPVLTVGSQIRESLGEHENLRGRAATERATELLSLVGIPSPRERLDAFPHEFSGGMRQRAMIAIALASSPQLLLADEPTTALDVTIQDQILKLLLRLRDQFGMAVILVTHDLGVVAQTCDRVAVMYAGRLVETAPVRELFSNPKHAYTLGLRRSVPDGGAARTPLAPIGGSPPDLRSLPPGCPFAPRCAWSVPACREAEPPLTPIGADHASACIRHDVLSVPEKAHS